MPPCRLPAAPAAVALLLALAAPAQAVITVLTPLKQVLDAERLIFTAEVTAVDPDKPAVTLKVGDDLKGKCGLETLAVDLAGDGYAKKNDHTRVMLDRLAAGRKFVLFASPAGKGYSAFGYLEGTWFQIKGTPGPDGKDMRWAFLHCEPYFRRTFKGTTAELKSAVEKYLSGKGDPPPPDDKEPAGYGPKAEPKKCGMRNAECGIDRQFCGPPFPDPRSALFGVIPSFVLVGPLAAVAALFPGVFARLAVGLQRWRAFLVVAGVNNTLALVYWALRERRLLPDTPAAGGPAFLGLLMVVTAGGLIVAARRYPAMAAEDPALAAPPTRGERLALTGLTLAAGAFVAVTTLLLGRAGVRDVPGRELTAVAVGLAAATGWQWVVGNGRWVAKTSGSSPADVPGREGEAPAKSRAQRLGRSLALPAGGTGRPRHGEGAPTPTPDPATADRSSLLTTHHPLPTAGPLPTLSGETVGLAAMFAFGAVVLAWGTGRNGGPASADAWEAATGGEPAEPVGPRLTGAKVLFETADADQVLSGVTAAGDRLVFGTMRQAGFRTTGAVYCVDRETGKPVWVFDDGGELKPVFSTPAADGGRVYVGEGLHTDADRRLFALDAGTGKPVWRVTTRSHTEGSPTVAGDRVIFAAGDDGLFAVAAAGGQELWHLPGAGQRLHIDTPPAVAGGRVFFGSGYTTLALLAADAATGRELWRTPVGLRAFGPPLPRGDRVYFGIGTGNLIDDLSTEAEPGVPAETTPAGAVVCLDARTGTVVWRAELPKSVHSPLAADRRAVYACCKSGWVYALGRADGKVRWKRRVGAGFAAGPVVAAFAQGAAPLAVYAVSKEGRAVCLDPADGAVLWARDLAGVAGRKVDVLSTPAVVAADPAGTRRAVYVGAMLTSRNTGAKSAAVFRLDDDVGE